MSLHQSDVDEIEKSTGDIAVVEHQNRNSTPDSGVTLAAPGRLNVWTKLDLLVLPMVFVMFLIGVLDLANIGNARIAGLQERLRISDPQFSTALTVAMISPMVLQIPMNYLIIIVGPRIVLPTLLILMGIAVVIQGFVTSYGEFLACRMFGGLFSGVLLSGIIIYLACFYPRRMLQLRMSIVMSSIAFASALSGLLASAIIHMDGIAGRPGWAWLFILEGGLALIFGVVCLYLLPNTPTEALFLTEEEKRTIACVLREDGIQIEDTGRGTFWDSFGSTFTQPHVILLGIASFFYNVIQSGLGYFLPSIIVGLGYQGSHAQLMSVPPYAIGAFLSITTAILSDRYAVRGLTISVFSALATVGFALYIGSTNTHVRYGSLLLLVPCSFCVGPCLGTWISNNTAPLVRRTIALGFDSALSQVGAVLSVWLFGTISPGPRFMSATVVLLAFSVGTILCAVSSMAYFAGQNRRKARLRAAYSNAGAWGTTTRV
ncbi:MFS general substrate transporter [Daedaleopsis nitida]|nr:MFS general substrate transporter [Daedaleopsis nitida]